MTAVAEPTAAAPAAEIGKARRRKEDAHLITGRTRWTDNITLPGMQHIAVLRSPMAHATIVSIDTSAAKSAAGVVGVWTGEELTEQGGLPCAWPITADMKSPVHNPVAVGTVKHAGEIVAVVAARSKAEAVDAVELIDVEYDALPVVTDMEAALADGATLIHPELETNRNAVWVFDSGQAGTGGNVEEALAAAAADDDQIVVERTFRQQRLIPAFMEPRSTVVDPTGDGVVMWSATQVPHILKLMIALTQGIPEHQVRVIAPDVGGGFGGKLQVTPEEIVTLMVARRLRKPAKYTETRSESLLAAHHGRDQIQRLKMSARKDGTITGFDVDLLADMGAYLGLVTPGVPILGAFMFNAIYKIPAYRFTCTNVFTNKTMTDAYRGAGRPEATFAIERMMDELAAELGMEPMEVRRKNWIAHEEFPFTTVAGLTYDSGNYEAATDKAMELFDYDALRAEQQQRRASGDRVQLGIGISTFTEMCGLAPSRVLGSLSYGAGGWETASIRMLPSGAVEVVTGSSAHGQGHETAWSQIVADQLGVPFENISIIHGDTQSSPKGLDTYGSRSLAVGGIAVVKAAEKVVAKAKTIAAHMLEASEDDLEFAGGTFSVKGTDQSKSIGDIALGGVRRARPAGRSRGLAGLGCHLRPGELLLPARHPPVCGRGGHRDRQGAPAVLRLRGRRRRGGQPADRRGPGARRFGAGHRPGAVRGRHVHRGRPAHRRAPWWTTWCRPPPDLPSFTLGPHGHPVDHEPVGRQGRRRGRHHRVHPGGGQRDHRRGAAPRRRRHRDALHAAEGVAGDPGRRRTRHRCPPRPHRPDRPAVHPAIPAPCPPEHRPRPKESRHDPLVVRLRRP